MIIAGPCLYAVETQREQFIETAKALKGLADFYRCKLWGGGTRPDRFFPGMSNKGLEMLDYINGEIMPVMTEVQSNHQIMACEHHSIESVWIGARNSQNYGLMQDIIQYWPKNKPIMIKRNAGMTIDELIGIFDIYLERYNRYVYFIERGINTFDRQEHSRWSPDLKGAIRLKHERPEIFDRLVVDCSHSVGVSSYIKDVYAAFEAIGVNHFMFECTIDGESLTDQNQMLSVKDLENILLRK